MRRSYRNNRTEDATFEINLAPMLDIIVSIVPMLLLSVVFVKISVIDSQIPQVVANAIEKDRKQENRDVSVSVYIVKDRTLKIILKEQGKEQAIPLAKGAEGLDLKTLHAEIVKIKVKYPSVFRMELHPDEEIPYSEIVSVLDRVRTRDATDPKISFDDAESGRKVDTELLFPDVVFGNVTEA